MKKTVTAFFAVTVSLIPLFAKGGRQPAWISNPYAGYDETKYIAATAGARTADAADKKALLAAAANIVQDISAEESVTNSDSSAGANLTSYLSDIRTKSMLKDISGMAIKDRWTAKDKIVYARAVLDKTAAALFAFAQRKFNRNRHAPRRNRQSKRKRTRDGKKCRFIRFVPASCKSLHAGAGKRLLSAAFIGFTARCPSCIALRQSCRSRSKAPRRLICNNGKSPRNGRHGRATCRSSAHGYHRLRHRDSGAIGDGKRCLHAFGKCRL